ncbi:helix-turn-helix domain-containing protein [Streptomyces radicis]|uniref:XRE family transcriptional regulator n=1 Tax=Streptomyces radicis TaxID=1750517 RepID=A0A3A9VSB6_9ACTN|nr:helix-turn-helix transcriptional regulator [Streptomyces radicis]RKN03669.1 XRE family transcriptional regulator [Streptomyces radicis]RKN13513.1 XRE family transcriptional regulator [Streptomyces radicis]
MSATPNTALKAVRMGLLMSQDDLARALRAEGVASASKRLVQRWEAGETACPRPLHARALERVTRTPIELLGFTTVLAQVHEDGRGGHDVEPDSPAPVPAQPLPTPAPGRGAYSGIWLSRYEYYSSGRSGTYEGLHHVVILQHGSQLTVRSVPGSSDSLLTIDLQVDGHIVTGTWAEQTAQDGYYRGARYHGAIQMLLDPTGRRMTGKWVGFGKEFDINSGPWELVFQEASTSKATTAKYGHRPDSVKGEAN